MVRWSLAGALAALLVAGCGDARKPTVRGGAAEPAAPSADVSAPEAAAHPPLHGESFPSPHGELSPESLGPEVVLGSMSLTAPDGWTRKRPSSGFVLAEFTLPRAEEDLADGRLTVTSVAGSVEANIVRWRGQFGGNPEKQSQEPIDVSGIPITLVDLSGTYGGQQMGPMSAEPRPGYRMQAAVFSLEGRQFIIKAVGPEKTMARHADAFTALVRSLKPSGSDSPDADSTDGS
ncbi:MAG: hypothetical protein HQ582_00060 [Planctomycetes bacterium]|nr:hypothetical protein [Planctomycetota bacterium]